MEFSRQEYRSGLLFPSPGDLPNPGIKPRSPALQVDSLPFRRGQVWISDGLQSVPANWEIEFCFTQFAVDTAECVHVILLLAS